MTATPGVTDFRLGLTADFYRPDGQLQYADIGLDRVQSVPSFAVRALSEHQPELIPAQLQNLDGVIVLSPRVTAKSLQGCPELLAIGRFGVGYDSVDVAACTAADVLLYITAGAVDHSVAEATVGWMLALTHHMRTKDQLVRTGQWDARSRYMGRELRDRTIGLVGFGGIGKAVFKLLSGFGIRRPLVYDPGLSDTVITEWGGTPVPLDELLQRADIVTLHCPLNKETRGLIGARELALMPPTSYLINTARGGIVDEDALFRALQTGQIAGAALDCFVGEPITAPHRFGELDNVLLAPHSIAWTDELFRDIGRAAFQGMLDLSRGLKPRGVINPELFDRPSFIKKWNRICYPALPCDLTSSYRGLK